MFKPQKTGHTICVIKNFGGSFMKKLFTVALIFVMVCTLAACGCQAQETTPVTTMPATTAPTTTVPPTETTLMTTEPALDATMGTNIPDPTVDSNSTEETMDTTGTVNEDAGSIIDGGTDEGGARNRIGR